MRLDMPYLGASYIPPVAPSTVSGIAQSAWFTVNSADASALTQAGTASASTVYTDTAYPHAIGAITSGNHYFGYVTSATAGTDMAVASVALVTPRGAMISQLSYCAPFVGTIRLFLSADQLFRANVNISAITTTALPVGTILEPEAVLNFVDFCKLIQKYNMKLVPVLYIQDTTAGHTHAFYHQALHNISGQSGTNQTTAEAAQTQTYLNALTEFLQFIDAYEVCRSVIAGIDLHNEVYYQLGGTGADTGLNSTASGFITGAYTLTSVQADIKVWLRKLLQAANNASGSFLYGFSENSRLTDATDALRAPTLANQEAAIDYYGDVDFYDLHWYLTQPYLDSSYTALGTGLSGKAGVLQACLNLPKPWFAGEATCASGVHYDGNAAPHIEAVNYWARTLQDYGARSICTPSIGFMSNQTNNTNPLVYEPQTVTGLYQAIMAAQPRARHLG